MVFSPIRMIEEEKKSEFFLNKFLTAKNFKLFAGAVLIVMILISFDFGINGDEKFQVDYSKKLWSYYSTFGKDTSALNIQDGQMHLYGGLFEVTSVAINKLLGITNEHATGFHATRRVLCACFGFLAILFTCLFTRKIAGWPAAFLALVLMLFSPRFFGDMMINPKDIPFAAGYIMALYFLVRFIDELPKPQRSTMIGLITGIAIALNTRAGGLLLIIYLFLFVGISVFRKWYKRIPIGNDELLKSLGYTVLVGVISYFAGILFWPYALQNPLVNPLKALTEFTNQSQLMMVLFKGQHIWSAQLPWNYLPHWIIRTIPLFAIIGILFFLRLLKNRSSDLSFMGILILLFAVLFPISYAIYKHSTLHDGWRHFIFIYPPLIILATTGWYLWFTSFRSRVMNIISALILVFLLTENLISIISLHPFQYIYFNPLFGGVHKAFGNFETDYWMLSIKEGAQWLKEHERLGEPGHPAIVATNCFYPADIYLTDSLKQVKTVYTRYYERTNEDWDYALFYSRFVDRDQLLNHTWPPKGTVYTIQTEGTILCAIVKRLNKEDFLGAEAWRKNDIESAILHLKKANESDPANESVAMLLANAYKSTCQYMDAERTIISSLRSRPANPEAYDILKSIQAEKMDALLNAAGQ